MISVSVMDGKPLLNSLLISVSDFKWQISLTTFKLKRQVNDFSFGNFSRGNINALDNTILCTNDIFEMSNDIKFSKLFSFVGSFDGLYHFGFKTF